MKSTKALLCLAAVACAAAALADGEQQFAEIGDLPLASGGVVKACRVGYRTFGKLDDAKDNAVLVPTWFMGTSGDLVHSFGRGGMVDSSKYYVIAVDALGNGVSTSPSNSRQQPEGRFPAISIFDMVESQYRMLNGLGIRHLHAVTGISMGGIQTFQWVFAHPEFVDCAIPMVGSPQATSYDIMSGGAVLKAVRAAEQYPLRHDDIMRPAADFFYLALHTPAYYVAQTKRADAANSMLGFEGAVLRADPYDIDCDLSAIIRNDDYAAFGGDIAKAAASVKARLLVISASQDHAVNPAPALDLARRLNAPTLVLTDDDGHQSIGAEMGKIAPAIAELLSK